jgi:hypothetical protein
LCCYFLFAWVAWIFLSSDDQAGGSPAATHFLCFAKESKQRKATASSQPPSGVPGVVEHKSGTPDWLAAPRQGTEVGWKSSFFATAATTTQIATTKDENYEAEGECSLAMRSEPVWNFRLEPAGDAMRKMEKEGKLV